MLIYPHNITESKPVKWQVAVNGIWEEAKPVMIGEQPNVLESVINWSSNERDVAIECFFDLIDGDIAFLGVRLESLDKSKRELFLKEIVSEVSGDDNFLIVREKIAKKLQDTNFLNSYPKFIELGAEGFWKSYGSQVVWRQDGKKPYSIDKIREVAPQLLDPFKHPMMMELAWNEPLPIWLGLQISEKNGGNYEFSSEKYRNYLNSFMSSCLGG